MRLRPNKQHLGYSAPPRLSSDNRSYEVQRRRLDILVVGITDYLVEPSPSPGH